MLDPRSQGRELLQCEVTWKKRAVIETQGSRGGSALGQKAAADSVDEVEQVKQKVLEPGSIQRCHEHDIR